MYAGLDRDSIIDGLRELIQRAERAGVAPISIKLIGGAALRLSYFDRAVTVDIDAMLTPAQDLQHHIEQIADERGWPHDWLNDAARRAGFIPTWGKAIDWVPIYEVGDASIHVASPSALLAMKIRAFESRGRRDLGDVLQLLPLAGVMSAEEVETLFEEYFPGDGMRATTIEFLEGVFADGLVDPPEPPPAPRF